MSDYDALALELLCGAVGTGVLISGIMNLIAG